MEEISLTVKGWPPKKGEALSMFNRKHGDNVAVRVLLTEIKNVLAESEWNKHESRPLGIELIITGAPIDAKRANFGDATNYLGGVADVLQADRARIKDADTSHIDDLLSESLYCNDSQIREIRCHLESCGESGYHVRIWVL